MTKVDTKKKTASAKAAVKPTEKAKSQPKAAAAAAAADNGSAGAGKSRRISIEACKSWGVFKTKSSKVEKALKDAGYSNIEINKEKPRKGSFVVRVEGSTKPLIELLDLPRPFTKLRDLDLEGALKSLTSN